MSDQRIATNDLTVWTYDWCRRARAATSATSGCAQVIFSWPYVVIAAVLALILVV